MNLATTWVAALVLLLWQAPARDRSNAPTVMPVGSASISGVVVTADEAPQVVRHASVTLSTGLLSVPRVVVTDDQGRFSFEGLPAGSYRVVAHKTGWVPMTGSVQSARVAGGVVSLAGQGLPVVVGAKDALTGLTLRVQRGAVLSGTVFMPGGSAASGMTVMALRTSRIDGVRRTAMSSEPVATDDQGRYRIYGLAPGDYVVQVRSALVAVQAVDVRQTLPSEVRWAEALVAQSTTPMTAGAALPPAPDPGPTVTFSTTYLPGTEYLTQATVVTLRAGEERLNLDFEVRRVPTTTVSGSVMGTDGRPAANAVVTLMPPESAGQEEFLAQMVGAGRAFTRADGSFVLTGVSPGAYTLAVRARSPHTGDGPAPVGVEQQLAVAMAGLAGLPGASTGMSTWAQESIDVAGQPIGPLTLQLREGLRVAGTVVFEGSAGVPSGVRVSLSGAGEETGLPDIPMLRPNASVVPLKPDATFILTGIVPGRYRLSVQAPGLRPSATEAGEGWMVKSIHSGDRDLADYGLDLQAGGDLAGVVITLTRRPSELSGTVLDGAARPFSAFPLVIFSAGREFWMPGSRRVVAVQPSTDGRYVVAGLPAGAYYLAVVTEVDTRELSSATFLESLLASAIPLTLADGEHKVQDVRLAGGESSGRNPFSRN